MDTGAVEESPVILTIHVRKSACSYPSIPSACQQDYCSYTLFGPNKHFHDKHLPPTRMDMPRRSYDEVLAEREQYPFGKPRPYSPDHVNLLAEGLAPRRAEFLPRFSSKGRTILVLIALLALGYGVHGVVTNDLYLPGKRSPGVHYHGTAALLIFGMILSFAASLIVTAFSRINSLDHKPENRFLLTCLYVSTIIFTIAGIAVNRSVP